MTYFPEYIAKQAKTNIELKFSIVSFDRSVEVHAETLRKGIQNIGSDITLKEKRVH